MKGHCLLVITILIVIIIGMIFVIPLVQDANEKIFEVNIDEVNTPKGEN